MLKKMTVSEALKEGYKFYGKPGDEVLTELSAQSFDDDLGTYGEEQRFTLSEKQAFVPKLAIQADSVCEMLYLNACDQEVAECGLDPITDLINEYEPEFKKILEKIEERMRKENTSNTYMETDIQLISNIS